ncbi:MAG TPA: hypothetical protein VK615_12000 [Candidatus Binatia bacterium]|nr:hypothetical protein [Candidatus Binatia bacterium]
MRCRIRAATGCILKAPASALLCVFLIAPVIDLQAAEAAPPPRVFQTPLVAIRPPPDAETTALRSAIDQYARRTVRDDFSALENFLEAYPDGSWSTSVHAGLGEESFTVGRYSRALEHWRRAWTLSHAASGREAVALADKSLTELALMLLQF